MPEILDIEILDMLKRKRREIKDGLEYNLDGTETGKLLKTLRQLDEYMEDRDGFRQKGVEIGPKNNPNEVDYVYLYRNTKITVQAKRSRYEEGKHDIKLTFTSKERCVRPVADALCMSCLRKSLRD